MEYRVIKDNLRRMWLVTAVSERGELGIVTHFIGIDAEQRARDYAAWMNAGAPMPKAEKTDVTD